MAVASYGATNHFGSDPELNRIAVLYGQVPGAEAAEEPSCKDAPRNIGDVEPEIPCDLPTAELKSMGISSAQLRHFHFCKNSDVLLGSATEGISALIEFAHAQAAHATFVVHGFASIEGKAGRSKKESAAYNQRLSCHRALRVARELRNIGVRAEQIREVSGLGETTAFGAPEFNQVAVVLAESGKIERVEAGRRPVDTPQQKQAIVDAAREQLMAGQYNLGADAYISFWTCGRTATVRQAVEHLNIVVQKDTSLARAKGIAEGIGVNRIQISHVALSADNPIECTMGQIVATAFHHAVLGDPDLSAAINVRSAAGRHLAHLAGLGACRGRLIDVTNADPRAEHLDQPQETDPLADTPPPPCAEAPQGARLLPPAKGAKRREAPAFLPLELNFTPATGKLLTNFVSGETKAESQLIIKPEKDIFTANASVQLSGNPDTFGDYEVGFIQAVLDDETEVEYDSGHTVIQQLPTPIRLAALKGEPPAPMPWTTGTAMAKPNADGKVSATASGLGLSTEIAAALRKLQRNLPNAGLTSLERGRTYRDLGCCAAARRAAGSFFSPVSG